LEASDNRVCFCVECLGKKRIVIAILIFAE